MFYINYLADTVEKKKPGLLGVFWIADQETEFSITCSILSSVII